MNKMKHQTMWEHTEWIPEHGFYRCQLTRTGLCKLSKCVYFIIS